MTITQIKAFLTLYNSDSAAKAADKLFITQPALSRIIKTVECELGYDLFARGKGKSLMPTDAGTRFYSIASEMARLYEQARRPEKSVVRRIFRVSATASLFFSFFPNACIRFQRENPNVDLVVDEIHSMEAYRQMQLNQIDFAIVNAHFTQAGIKSIPICKEKVVVICSKGMYAPGPVSPGQLDKSSVVITEWNPDFQSWFEYWFGRSFEDAHLRLRTGCYLDRFTDLPQFWAIVPYANALHMQQTGNFDIHDLTDAPPDRVCYCIYPRSDTTELEKGFLSCVQQSLKDTEGIQIL